MASSLYTTSIDISTAASPFNIPLDAATNQLDCLLEGYRIYGTIALGAPFVFGTAGTPLSKQNIKIYWEATVSGNSVTILGATVPTAILTKKFIADCSYNGTAWVVKFLVSWDETNIVVASTLATDAVETAKIKDLNVTTNKLSAQAVTNTKMYEMAAYTVKGNETGGPKVPGDLSMTDLRNILAQKITLSGAVTAGPTTETPGTGVTTLTTVLADDVVITKNILDNNVTVAKVSADLKKELITLMVSCTTTDSRDLKIKMPYSGSITGMYANVTEDLAAGDDATIQLKDDAGTSMTDGLITFVNGVSLTAGNAFSVTPSADNIFITGDIITLTVQKVTAGGLIQISLEVTRS